MKALATVCLVVRVLVPLGQVSDLECLVNWRAVAGSLVPSSHRSSCRLPGQSPPHKRVTILSLLSSACAISLSFSLSLALRLD